MMRNRIADLFQIRNRFMRSVHLERDFAEPEAVRGYVMTPPAVRSLKRLAGGLAPRSGQRAWRVTGDFGTGKSSFALLVAHLFSGQTESLSPELKRSVD